MVKLIIVDYSFLYYKYKFQLDAGRMRRLTTPVEVGGVLVEHDVSQIYYSLKEIEKFRKAVETNGDNAIVAVCFDRKSDRKESDTSAAAKYKSNRGHKLTEEDFFNISLVRQILDVAGYNTYAKDGFEADDLITNLVNNYANHFDAVSIYTPDADILVNIRDNVNVMRYKSKMGYTLVDKSNFSTYLGEEMKCKMPYNALMLYKCTVGDKSDCIDGIRKFGPKAFDNLVDHLTGMGINWGVCGNEDAINQILNALSNYFTDVQLNEARTSLELVKPKVITDISELAFPMNVSSYDKRVAAYTPYRMNSLIE